MGNNEQIRYGSHALACLARFFLFTVARPATRLIALSGGKSSNGVTTQAPLGYRLLAPLARPLNWVTQGAITISHPKMAYDPVVWRKKRLLSQWAAQITDIPEEKLDSQARKYIESRQSIPPSATASNSITFTILIGFHTHLDFFKSCINSVAAAAAKAPEVFLELLIVNDDPSISTTLLENIVSGTDLQSLIRSNHANLGICRSINESLPHAKGDWILYLDCDDQLRPDAIVSLQRTIRNHPGIRFISSRAVDQDEDGFTFAYRLRDESPVDLIENNYASHLKAIRKDLNQEIGGFDALYEGCQDFEFALRASLFDRLLFIPDYLYQYRWHDRSQTVDNCSHQNNMMIRVRQTYLLAIQWILHGPDEILIRTTGEHAAEWAKKIPASAGQPSWSIELEASAPFSQTHYKLLLIRIAGRTVQAISQGRSGELPPIAV
jgi:glycosyltransferase involved in cell wall biosynthesis